MSKPTHRKKRRGGGYGRKKERKVTPHHRRTINLIAGEVEEAEERRVGDPAGVADAVAAEDVVHRQANRLVEQVAGEVQKLHRGHVLHVEGDAVNDRERQGKPTATPVSGPRSVRRSA